MLKLEIPSHKLVSLSAEDVETFIHSELYKAGFDLSRPIMCGMDIVKDVHTYDQQEGCEYCRGAEPLVIGKTNDQGITIKYPNILAAYGYDVHGSGSNGLEIRINRCPMCGYKLGDQ